MELIGLTGSISLMNPIVGLESCAYTRSYAFQACLFFTVIIDRNFEVPSHGARARIGVWTRLLEPVRQTDQIAFKDAAPVECRGAWVRDEPARRFARGEFGLPLHRGGHYGDADRRRRARAIFEGRTDASVI